MIASTPQHPSATAVSAATTTATTTTPMIDSATKEKSRHLAADAALLLGKSPMGLSPEIAKWLMSKQSGPVSPKGKLTDRIEDLENRIYRKQIEADKNREDEKLQEELRDLSNERSKLLQLYWTQYMPVATVSTTTTTTLGGSMNPPPVSNHHVPSHLQQPPQTPSTSSNNNNSSDVNRNRETLRLQMASPATGMAAEVLTQIARGNDNNNAVNDANNHHHHNHNNNNGNHYNNGTNDEDGRFPPTSPSKRRKRKTPGDTLHHVTGPTPQHPPPLQQQPQQQQHPPMIPPPPPPPVSSMVMGLNTSISVAGIRCQCKKSKCLKLYCDCFAARKLCVPNECRCISCENFSENEPSRIEAVRYVLSKRSDAFQDVSSMSRNNSIGLSNASNDSSVSSGINFSGSSHGMNKPASNLLMSTAPGVPSAHLLSTTSDGNFSAPISNGNGLAMNTLSSLRGCFCRKSQCLKKYCVCFNARVQCGTWCRCLDCANGRPHDPAVDVSIHHHQQQQQQQHPQGTFLDSSSQQSNGSGTQHSSASTAAVNTESQKSSKREEDDDDL